LEGANNRPLRPPNSQKLNISREIPAILTFNDYFNCVDRTIGTPLACYVCQSQRAIARRRDKPLGYTLFEEEQRSLSIMLVLSRKVGERIHVGDNIVLEIRRIAGNRVTVALEAPRDVRILRGELEGPAKEFRTPGVHGPEPVAAMATPAHLSVLTGLPNGQVERHLVT
jgi:carbon storage regulator